jgi:ribosomal protein S27AE
MLIRQPNGKFCVCDWNGKVERMNLTEKDYIEYCANNARKLAMQFISDPNNISDFGNLIEMKNVSDNELKEMGSDKTFEELIKYVPLVPHDQKYISVNFQTQGKCPSCGEIVVDGMGHTDKKCGKCGQMLKW